MPAAARSARASLRELNNSDRALCGKISVVSVASQGLPLTENRTQITPGGAANAPGLFPQGVGSWNVFYSIGSPYFRSYGSRRVVPEFVQGCALFRIR